MVRGALFALLGIVLVGVLEARNCYQCNSYTDRDHNACVDPMSPYPAVNYTVCPNDYVCTRVSYITQKTYVVSRGCDPYGNTCDNILRSLRSYYSDVSSFNCYTCTNDYCNGSSGLEVQGPLKEVEKSDN